MTKIILYVDGENLRHYLKKVLQSNNVKAKDIALENFNLGELFKNPLKGIRLSEKRYYSTKLRLHQETQTKSRD